MQKFFVKDQPFSSTGSLPAPDSAEYDWWLSERGLLNIATGEDALVAQATQRIVQPLASATSCPRERGEHACEGCKCA